MNNFVSEVRRATDGVNPGADEHLEITAGVDFGRIGLPKKEGYSDAQLLGWTRKAADVLVTVLARFGYSQALPQYLIDAEIDSRAVRNHGDKLASISARLKHRLNVWQGMEVLGLGGYLDLTESGAWKFTAKWDELLNGTLVVGYVEESLEA